MTPEALWSFEFIDNREHHGGGVVVFYRNQALGGNNGFTYVGEYSLRGTEIFVEVDVKRYNARAPGIYNDEFRLSARGRYDDLEFILTGSPADNDDLILAIQCKRQAEIPV